MLPLCTSEAMLRSIGKANRLCHRWILGAPGSLLPVLFGSTGRQAASGTQAGGVKIKATARCGFSMDLFPLVGNGNKYDGMSFSVHALARPRLGDGP